MNDLRYFTLFNGETTDAFIIGDCIFCKESYSVRVSEYDLRKFGIGTERIQDIFPTHPIYDREFLLSGLCPKCQFGDGKTKSERELEMLAYRFDILKKDYISFSNILTKNNIHTLYHFTDEANIPSIKQFGALFSLQYIDENKIRVARPGGSEQSKSIDYSKGLANFIRLSFVEDHPMKYVALKEGRIKKPYLLEIDTELLLTEPSLFTKVNAASRKARAYNDSQNFEKIDFSLFSKRYYDLSEHNKKHYQAEVLIPERIELRFIRNI